MLGTKILHSDVLGFLKIDQGTPRVDFEQDRVTLKVRDINDIALITNTC